MRHGNKKLSRSTSDVTTLVEASSEAIRTEMGYVIIADSLSTGELDFGDVERHWMEWRRSVVQSISKDNDVTNKQYHCLL